MTKRLGITDSCKDDNDRFGKGFCLSIVHTGVNKCLSNNAVIETYDTAINGMKEYHKFVKTTSTQLNSVTLAPPVEISLNKNNIEYAEKAILEAYKIQDGSIYDEMRKSIFWGLMHDGISKFTKEYNGVYLRGVNESFDPFVAPYCLQKMNGGVNAYDLVEALIKTIANFMNVKHNAFDEIRQYVVTQPIASTPTYFKLGKIIEVIPESKEIHIEIADNIPVGNCGDGVAVNEKAARLLGILLGMNMPSFRCSAHAADGSLKRLARSQTMSVEQVTLLYPCLKTVTKHFTNSCKSKEQLDKAMCMLELKPIHMLSWCATRMAHFMEACVSFDDILIPMYDTMFTSGLRKEDRDKLFTAENIYTVKVIKDLNKAFFVKYLRKVDKTFLLVSTVYKTAQDAAIEISDIATPTADEFLDLLQLDPNGNLNVELELNSNKHKLRLSNTHKPTRGQSEVERLNKLKEKLVLIKTEIVKNIEGNIRDQCDDQTQYYGWSALDLADTTASLELRVNKIQELMSMFTANTIHTVKKYANAKETKLEADKWMEHTIFLHYPPRIPCTEEELVKEFQESWPILNGLWFKEINCALQEKRSPDQLATYKIFIQNHAIQRPNLCRLFLILIATPANTSCLERAYTFLEMVCTKRRNQFKSENIETLFLLAALKLPVKSANDYAAEIQLLEN